MHHIGSADVTGNVKLPRGIYPFVEVDKENDLMEQIRGKHLKNGVRGSNTRRRKNVVEKIHSYVILLF